MKNPNCINGISVTGDTVILNNRYARKGKMRPGLSYSVNDQGKWSEPIPIQIRNDYNKSDNRDTFVCLGIGVIIAAIQRKDSHGDRDLYVSFWNEGGEATEPINMGGVINSHFEESSPYLAHDRKTLYFASKGHQGYGGYDIFRTVRLDNSWTNWSEPENMGPVVNSPLDDKSFIITHCQRFAYFSRQITVHNVDLFRIPVAELYSHKARFR